MDDVTRAALEIAVEQLEEAEKIIEALTEENEHLKNQALINDTKFLGGTYPRQSLTWTAGTNSTATHTALLSASASATQTSAAVVNLTARTKQFKESLEKLRNQYEDMHFENDVEVSEP